MVILISSSIYMTSVEVRGVQWMGVGVGVGVGWGGVGVGWGWCFRVC
jgi:hypothetical protein